MNNNLAVLSAEQQEIMQGLSAKQKWLSPKYFYDQVGSQYFAQITQLDEYYPTRTELSIFEKYAREIAKYVDSDSVIIEPGAGSCEKIQYLLPALEPKAFIPQDVSGDYLYQVVQGLQEKHPGLEISPIVSDFSEPMVIPEQYKEDAKYIFYPGSTIGNFEPEDAVKFLKNMRQIVGVKGGLILGADLQKDISVLEAAYNDQKGITAEFNLNILNNINGHLEQKILRENFSHHAFYNTQANRIEMHLKVIAPQTISSFGQDIEFKVGETIHTENSYKYTHADIRKLAQAADFSLHKTWLDKDKLFSVNLLLPI